MLIKNWTTEFNEEVYRLEQICFEYPWNKDMVEETASGDNFSGVVAVEDDKTVGYAGAVFALDVADIALVAVAPDYTAGALRSLWLKSYAKICLRAA